MNLEQLKKELDILNVDPSAYTLLGGLPNECYVFNQAGGGIWEVYYSERGEKTGIRTFDTESSATRYFLEMICKDGSTRRK